MKFLSIVRYFSGCVSLKFEGVFIEKFLNLLIKNNIGFWNLTKSEISVSFCTNLKNYKTVVLLSEKCGLELCGTVEKGVPKIIRKYQKRYGIAAGILIFCAFIAASSRFIWKVEVSGNQTVPTSLILSAAEKYGVKAGALFSSVNALGRSPVFMDLTISGGVLLNKKSAASRQSRRTKQKHTAILTRRIKHSPTCRTKRLAARNDSRDLEGRQSRRRLRAHERLRSLAMTRTAVVPSPRIMHAASMHWFT